MIDLSNREIVGLYLVLSKQEEDLDLNLQMLANRIEKYIFDKISIQELEKLEELYKRGIDVLA